MSEGMSERVRKVEECDNGLEKECLKEFQRDYMRRKCRNKKGKIEREKRMNLPVKILDA